MYRCCPMFILILSACGPGDDDIENRCLRPDPPKKICDPDLSWEPVMLPEAATQASDLSGILRVYPLGDLNGDGYGDLGVVADDLLVLDGTSLNVLATFSADLGRQLTPAGDLDGDGLTDVVVGDGDKRWLFRGSDLSAGSSIDSALAWASFVGFEGRELLSAAGGGDIDGDGRDDLVISEFNKKDSGRSNEEVRVISGKSLGDGNHNLGDFDSAFGAVVDGTGLQTLAIVGDFDGDGLDDIAAGAIRNFAAVHPSNNLGGGPFGGISDKEVHLHDCHPGEDCPAGASVGAVGDTDGDGLADVIVTSFPGDSAWVIPGNVLAGDFYRTKPFGGTLADAREVVGAASLAAAGDFDNNGLFDLIATEPNGQVWLIGGHLLTDRTLSLPASLDDLESETPTASHALSGFGAGVQATSAGDLNGDGLGDLVVWDDTDLYVFEAGE